ncbi:MAG TPA: hypothetical protein VGS58_21280, partial [Candidatus Sulfopaludibacter sp.]|nr:hypothetical protein [Candidatus Sulfopaludibacter sp.]
MRLAALFVAPAILLAQPVQVGPLEVHPDRPEIAADPKPASFGKRIAAAPTIRLGKLRQEEIDAVARDPRLALKGVERRVGGPAGGPQRGRWQNLDDGRLVWRMTVQADGAIGLRVIFTRF